MSINVYKNARASSKGLLIRPHPPSQGGDVWLGQLYEDIVLLLAMRLTTHPMTRTNTYTASVAASVTDKPTSKAGKKVVR